MTVIPFADTFLVPVLHSINGIVLLLSVIADSSKTETSDKAKVSGIALYKIFCVKYMKFRLKSKLKRDIDSQE